jgi:hypothetical protein
MSWPDDTLVLCIKSDGRRASTREFHRVASRVTRKLGGQLKFFDSGSELYHQIELQERLFQAVIIGHGSPTWVGLPGRMGIHRYMSSGPAVIPASMIGRLLRDKGCEYLSLATCMSGASPKWYRTKMWGKHVAPWGKAAYSDGGKYSIAAKLAVNGATCVRAHTTSGHTTFNPALREFDNDHGIGFSLKPLDMSIRVWNNEMRGERAEDRLIFLD